MRRVIVTLAASVISLGMAVSGQAAPSSSLVPLSKLTKSSVEQAQHGYGYGHRKCYKTRHCYGYGYHRKCHYKTVCHRGYH